MAWAFLGVEMLQRDQTRGEIIEVTWVLRKVTIQLPYVFLDPIIADLADPISTNGGPWYESYSNPALYISHINF
jgi:hypothetical protein